jgi:5-deoxy-glucuronate isomerase
MTITSDANALLLNSRDPGVSPGALIEVDVARAGWEFIGLTVMKLRAGERWSRETGPDEVALMPLGGRCTVAADGQTWTIGERENPFAGQPWAVYLPRDSAYEVTA